jgi:short-subunit dehydrogenase
MAPAKQRLKLLTEGPAFGIMATQVHVTVVFPGAIATKYYGEFRRYFAGSFCCGSKIKMTSASNAAAMIIDGMEKE